MKTNVVCFPLDRLRAGLATLGGKRAVCLGALMASALSMQAEVTLASLFRDGTVLQREQPVAVWGRATAGEKVQVAFAGQTVSVTTPASGRWRATLKPLKVSAQPAELVVTGANTVRVRDVLVGDVWLCSGQSNMAWMVPNSSDAPAEIAAANFPLVRHFKVALTAAEQPKEDVAGGWTTCSPATVGEFSAVAYFFARDLHQKLGVPVGIVNSSWGGTQIESWMSEPTLRAHPAGSEVHAHWEKRLADFPAAKEKHAVALEKWKANQAAAKKDGKAFNARAPVAPEGAGSRWLPASLCNGMTFLNGIRTASLPRLLRSARFGRLNAPNLSRGRLAWAAIVAIAAGSGYAQTIEEIPLRPPLPSNTPPRTEEVIYRHNNYDDRGFNRVVQRVTVPTLHVYRPAQPSPRGRTRS